MRLIDWSLLELVPYYFTVLQFLLQHSHVFNYQLWFPSSLQQNARHPETFTAHSISLNPEMYIEMMKAFYLPYAAIESTSCVGPFLWSTLDQDDDNPRLRLTSTPVHEDLSVLTRSRGGTTEKWCPEKGLHKGLGTDVEPRISDRHYNRLLQRDTVLRYRGLYQAPQSLCPRDLSPSIAPIDYLQPRRVFQVGHKAASGKRLASQNRARDFDADRKWGRAGLYEGRSFRSRNGE